MRVLITGGSRGIGRETAKLYRKHGAEVWICGRHSKPLKAVAAELGVTASVTDLSRNEDIASLFAAVSKEWGSLDVLVNNAADLFVAPLEASEPERIEHLFRVNVLGLMECSRRALPLLRKGQRPAIVNVASVSGMQGPEKFPGFSAYVASKEAVIGFTEVLALEVAQDGIRVNAVSPGCVDTDMLHKNLPDTSADMTPREVAEAIYFLGSSASRPMNGRNLPLY